MLNNLDLFKNIKLLIFDLQGVLVSNSFSFEKNELNQLYKMMTAFCDFAKTNNFFVAIISGLKNNQLVEEIALNIPCDILFASLDKRSQADKLVNKYNTKYENIFYIGDDLLDIPLLKIAALSAAPKQARREVKRVVDFICPGENGAERLEFITNSITNLNSQTVLR